MTRRLILIIAALALVVTSCGSEEETDAVASLENPTTTIAASTTTEAATQADLSEEQAIEFSQCMRDQGLDFPDPTVDADGNLEMGDLDVTAFGSSPDEIREKLGSAMDACSEHLEGISFGGGQLPDLVELQDTFLEFTTCMRDNGYDMPDPDFTGDGFGGLFEIGENIDPNDPVFLAAMEECQSIFTRFQQ
jgi:hypothetical protein